jgi:hypothetical protein
MDINHAMSFGNIKRCQVEIRDLIKADIVTMTPMEPIQYALSSGKRLRSMVVWSLTGNRHLTLLVEYIHTARTILVDMMHGTTIRRGQSALHIKYGEVVAYQVVHSLTIASIRHMASASASASASSSAAFDIHIFMEHGLPEDFKLKPPREQGKVVLDTRSTFELSFQLGAGTVELGHKFGICYQILRDLEGYKTPSVNNICRFFTRNELIDIFADNMEQFSVGMTQGKLWNPTIRELYSYLLKSFKKNITDLFTT